MFFKSLIGVASALLLVAAAPAPKPPTPAPQPAAAVPALEPENTLNLDLSTGGRVVIQLRPDIAPHHVERIKTLTRQGFYDGLIFHRVVEGFMAQGGDPTGTGTGGSTLPDLAAEFNALPHVRGAVSAARTAEPNTANSQFFIMFAPRLTLDRKYSVFGRVVSGMQYVDAIERGEPPLSPSRIVRASIGADNVPPMTPEQLAATAAQQAAAAASRQAAATPLVAPVVAAAPPAAAAPAAAPAPVADAPAAAAEAPPAAEPVAQAPAEDAAGDAPAADAAAPEATPEPAPQPESEPQPEPSAAPQR